MTTNLQLSTTKPKKHKKKNKPSKQLEQAQNHRNEDDMEGYQQGRKRRNGGKGTGNKQHKWWVESRQGELKNTVGNVEAEELICTTHQHELNGVGCGQEECEGQKGIKGRRKSGTTVIAYSIKYTKKKSKIL